MPAGQGSDESKVKKAKLSMTLEGLCDSVAQLLCTHMSAVELLPCEAKLVEDSNAFMESCMQLSGHINKMLESLERSGAAAPLQDLRNVSCFLQGSGEVMKMRMAVQELMQSVSKHLTVQPAAAGHARKHRAWLQQSQPLISGPHVDGDLPCAAPQCPSARPHPHGRGQPGSVPG